MNAVQELEKMLGLSQWEPDPRKVLRCKGFTLEHGMWFATLVKGRKGRWVWKVHKMKDDARILPYVYRSGGAARLQRAKEDVSRAIERLSEKN